MVPAMPHDRIGSAIIGVCGPDYSAVSVAVGYGRRVVGGGGVSSTPAIRLVVAIIVGIRSAAIASAVVARPTIVAISRPPSISRRGKPADYGAGKQATSDAGS